LVWGLLCTSLSPCTYRSLIWRMGSYLFPCHNDKETWIVDVKHLVLSSASSHLVSQNLHADFQAYPQVPSASEILCSWGWSVQSVGWLEDNSGCFLEKQLIFSFAQTWSLRALNIESCGPCVFTCCAGTWSTDHVFMVCLQMDSVVLVCRDVGTHQSFGKFGFHMLVFLGGSDCFLAKEPCDRLGGQIITAW
jgi:hypothetical protein